MNITSTTGIKGCLELVQYCDYYKITSIGQLIEVLTYTPKKYKTFEYCYDKIDDVVFDEPNIQVQKLQYWFDLLVNKDGFADLIDKYLMYKKSIEV